MKVLVGKTFGLGNAVLSIPLVKALKNAGHTVDLLVGSLQDDVGAANVFQKLKKYDNDLIEKIYFDFAKYEKYDLAIMAIPFDGRWKNKIHFHATNVIDCRSRPDPSTSGLISWKKHEIQYMMENVSHDDIPSTEFIKINKLTTDKKKIYLGIGYKKDELNFWIKKHWGNENFINLIKKIIENTDFELHLTGNQLDFVHVIKPILSALDFNKRINYRITSLENSFDVLSQCDLYVGNDTGMMHVAASMEIPCISLFFLENSIVKNPPWTKDKADLHVCLDNNEKEITVEEVYTNVIRKLNDC